MSRKSIFSNRIVHLALTMAVLWLLLSGMFKVLLLVLGVLSVLLVTGLSVRMDILTHRGQPIFINVPAVLRYWSWLIVEIMQSNYKVTRSLLDPDLPIKPKLQRVSATPDTEFGRVVYANSITLTPGTTAINFTRDGDILVHALHADSLDDLENDGMAARVREMEPHEDHGDSNSVAKNQDTAGKTNNKTDRSL